jgi:hypothetical protein
VSFTAVDDVAKKASAASCKQINATTLEVAVPPAILGNAFSRRCQVKANKRL